MTKAKNRMMKMGLVALASLALAGAVRAATTTVYFPMQSFTGTAQNRRVFVTPAVNPITDGTNIIAGMPITLQPTNGFATNQFVASVYWITVEGVQTPIQMTVTNAAVQLNAVWLCTNLSQFVYAPAGPGVLVAAGTNAVGYTNGGTIVIAGTVGFPAVTGAVYSVLSVNPSNWANLVTSSNIGAYEASVNQQGNVLTNVAGLTSSNSLPNRVSFNLNNMLEIFDYQAGHFLFSGYPILLDHGISSPGAGLNSEYYGQGASAAGGSATAVGYGATASATDGTALGSGATASANNGTALGLSSSAGGIDSTALGVLANAGNTHSTAIGKFATTDAANQIMLGTTNDNVVVPGTNLTIRGATGLIGRSDNSTNVLGFNPLFNSSPGNANGLTNLINSTNYNIVSSERFGGKGDGSTDDSAAVQAAIVYGEQNPGSIVLMYPKTYYNCLSSIFITSAVTIVGCDPAWAGTGGAGLTAWNPTFKFSGTNGFRCIPRISANGLFGITIQNVSVYGSGLGGNAGQVAFEFVPTNTASGAQALTLNACTATYCDTGFMFTNADALEMDNCVAFNCTNGIISAIFTTGVNAQHFNGFQANCYGYAGQFFNGVNVSCRDWDAGNGGGIYVQGSTLLADNLNVEVNQGTGYNLVSDASTVSVNHGLYNISAGGKPACLQTNNGRFFFRGPSLATDAKGVALIDANTTGYQGSLDMSQTPSGSIIVTNKQAGITNRLCNFPGDYGSGNVFLNSLVQAPFFQGQMRMVMSDPTSRNYPVICYHTGSFGDAWADLSLFDSIINGYVFNDYASAKVSMGYIRPLNVLAFPLGSSSGPTINNNQGNATNLVFWPSNSVAGIVPTLYMSYFGADNTRRDAAGTLAVGNVNTTGGVNVNGGMVTNGSIGGTPSGLVWLSTNLAAGVAPNATLPNGSILTTTNGTFFVRSNNTWVQK